MSKTPIRLLATGFFVLIALIFLMGIGAVRVVDSIADLTKNLHEHPFAVSNAVLQANADIIAMQRYMKDVPLAQNSEDLELAISLVDKHEAEVYRHFNLVKTRFLGDKSRIEEVRQLFADWKPIRTEVIEFTRQGKNDEASLITKDKGENFVAILTIEMEGLIEFSQNRADEFLLDHIEVENKSRLILNMLMAVIFVIGIIIAFFVVRRVNEDSAELRKSEEKHRLLSENVEAILWEFDIQRDRWTYVAPQVQLILGYSPEDFTDLQFWIDKIDEKDRTWASEYFAESVEKGTPHEFVYRFLKKDGSTIWLHDTIKVEMLNEQPVRMRGLMVDISKRKQAEEREQSLAGIIELSLNEIYIFDAKSLRFLLVNQAARKNLGHSMDELAEMTPLDIKPEFTTDIFEQEIKSLRTGAKKIRHILTVHQRKDGSSYPVEIYLQLMTYKSNPAFVAFILDITERNQFEETLQRSQKMEAVGQLAGGIAHDFNNLLAIFQGNFELLQDFNTKDNGSQNLIDTGLKTVERGASLTRRLLKFSRDDVVEVMIVNVNKTINGLTELLQKSLTPSIKVELNLEEDAWHVNINLNEFQDALVNLALNARDAMPEGGTLRIETSNTVFDEHDIEANPELMVGSYVCVSLSDTGCGMDEAMLGRVLEPFFTTKEAGKGTGLGLSMVYTFVRRNHGYVNLYSEVGYGTTVRLYLPMSERREEALDESHMEKVIPGGMEMILAVDDESELLQVVKQRLESLGYRVLTAGNGQEALDIINAHPGRVDLLFSDMVMPDGMSGYELAEAVKKRELGIKILLTSGFTKNTVNETGSIMAHIEILNKPFSKMQLANKVREILDGA